MGNALGGIPRTGENATGFGIHGAGLSNIRPLVSGSVQRAGAIRSVSEASIARLHTNPKRQRGMQRET